MFSNFVLSKFLPRMSYIVELYSTAFICSILCSCERIPTTMKVFCPFLLSLMMEACCWELHDHLDPFDMQQNSGMKLSPGGKNFIDFQLDSLGEGVLVC